MAGIFWGSAGSGVSLESWLVLDSPDRMTDIFFQEPQKNHRSWLRQLAEKYIKRGKDIASCMDKAGDLEYDLEEATQLVFMREKTNRRLNEIADALFKKTVDLQGTIAELENEKLDLENRKDHLISYIKECELEIDGQQETIDKMQGRINRS